TWLAVPAVLSGTYPTQEAIPQRGDLPQNLFSIVEATGAYESAIFEPVSRLASAGGEAGSLGARQPLLSQLAGIGPTVCRVFLFPLAPSDLQRYLPAIPPLWFGMRNSTHIDRSSRRGVFRYEWGNDRGVQYEHFLDCLNDSPRPVLYFQHILLP